MKIAIDVRSLCAREPSGVGHYVSEILQALPQNNHNIILFSSGRSRPNLNEKIVSQESIKTVHRFAPNKLINSRIALGQISLENLIGESIDVVWYPNTGFLPKTKSRTVVTVHDLAFHFFKDTYTAKHHLRYRLTKTIPTIKNADSLIAISDSTARDVESLRPRGSINTILHGLNHSAFTSRQLPQDKTMLQRLGIKTPYIASLATREPRKNLESIVEAFDKVAESFHSLSLVIAGGYGWKRKSLDNTVTKAKHSERIKIIGFVPDAARPALLRGAECLALPSRYEGFGMQVLEAMGCGTPVITSRNSSLSEVGGSACLYVRAMNVTELTRMFFEVLTDSSLRKSLSEQSEKRAQQFSWEKAAKQTLSVLESR